VSFRRVKNEVRRPTVLSVLREMKRNPGLIDVIAIELLRPLPAPKLGLPK